MREEELRVNTPPIIIPLNEHEYGICRTLKAQYGNTSAVNFLYKGSYGATGVLVIRKEVKS